MNFPKNLRELRLDRGLTQEIVAKAINVSQNTVCGWEKGVREPDYDTLVRLANYFGVSLEVLLL